MTSSPQQFYDTLTDNYDLIYRDWQAAVRQQGDIIKRLIVHLKGNASSTLLDCSCGIGTQAVGLALEGYKVHATDISPKEVERAKHEAAKLGASLKFGVADFRTLADQVEGTFDVVISFDNSLPHLLTDEDILQALSSMKEKLSQDGLLLISLRDYDAIIAEKPTATLPQVMEKDGHKRLYFQIWDWQDDKPIYTTTLFILKQSENTWEVESAQTQYRALGKETLLRLLSKVGFRDVAWHTPEESGYYQPVVSARK